MKTSLITLDIYSPELNARNVNTLCGHYKADVEIKQYATYTIADGLATIHSLTPVYGTVLNIVLPLIVPVSDLGSGQINRIEFNADTLTANKTICPRQAWATLRSQQPPITTDQQLIADYCGLL